VGNIDDIAAVPENIFAVQIHMSPVDRADVLYTVLPCIDNAL
jgi:hypothetical protein